MFQYLYKSVFQVKPLNELKYSVEVAYPDDPAIQVLDLAAPTREKLLEAIFRNTDIFRGHEIQILYKSDKEVKNVTSSDNLINYLIENSTLASMVRFQITVTKLVNSQAGSCMTVAPPPVVPSNTYDGFLSYQWGSQEIVKNIFKDLTEKYGLSIWMDLNNMGGAISSAMASGIESSKVFVPVLTTAYERSDNCLLEIRYAKDRKKPCAPVRLLKEGEVGIGETFAITAGLLYANFAGKPYGCAEWDDQINLLVREIRKCETAQPDVAQSVVEGSATPVDALKNWLNPVDFAADSEKHSSAYVPGTREFYLKAVHGWLQSTEIKSSVLWLNGGAGLGKSVIAWLVSQNVPTTFVLGSVFYCQHNDVHKSSPQKLVATTIWNLCNVLPSFRKFCEAFQTKDTKNIGTSILKDPQAAFQQIVVGGLRQLDVDDGRKSILLIFDALDECGAPGSKERTMLLDLLAQQGSNLPSFVRIFTTGRPELDVYRTMSKLDSMVLIQDDEENKKDMNLLVEAMLANAFPRAILSTEVVRSVSHEIYERSSGIFQVARLTCKQLLDVPADKLLSYVKGMAAGMDGVYDQYFKTNSVNTNNFRLVMKIVLAAKEPLTQDTVVELLGVSSPVVGQVLLELYRILDQSDHGKVKIIHKSLADYLLSPQRCADHQFHISISEAKDDIALACLRTMLKFESGVENKYEALNGTTGFTTASPTAQYAFKYWLQHLEEVNQQSAFDWTEWRDFASQDKYGPAALSLGILRKQDWIASGLMVDNAGQSLVAKAQLLKIFRSPVLYEAAKRGLTSTCKALIEFGNADINCRGFSWGEKKQYGEGNKTPLMIAARGNYSKTVELLLSMGANYTLRDGYDDNAEAYGCANQIKLWSRKKLKSTSLLEFFADSHTPVELQNWFQTNHASVDYVDIKKRTALHFASESGQLEVARWLLQQGAKVDAENAKKATPLHFASENGQLEVVKLLVRHGAKIEAPNAKGATPLYVASKNGHAEVIQWLLEEGAEVNVENVNNSTPLHIASQNGHLEVVKLLLQHRAGIEAQLWTKATPLYIASQNGQLEVVKWLLQQGAHVDAENVDGEAPLYVASKNGHLEVVKLLVQQGAKVNAPNVKKATPLHIAAEHGNVEVVKWLLQQGADVGAKNASKSTPLHVASQNGQLEVIQCLLQLGANINAMDGENATPLFVASRKGQSEVVEWLLQQGATVDQSDVKKATPLYAASDNGHLEVIKCLLRHGANVNAANMDKATPLYIASHNGHVEVVDWLLQGGADVNAYQASSWTSLHTAAQNGLLEVVERLHQAGANGEAENVDKATPLFIASKEGHIEVVEWLLRQGVNVDAEDVNRWTPLHIASQIGHFGVVKLLVQYGANMDAENSDNATPLQVASISGNLEVAKFLLKEGSKEDD